MRTQCKLPSIAVQGKVLTVFLARDGKHNLYLWKLYWPVRQIGT